MGWTRRLSRAPGFNWRLSAYAKRRPEAVKSMAIVTDNPFLVETVRPALRNASGLNVIGCIDGCSPVRSLTRAETDGDPARLLGACSPPALALTVGAA